ncbi:MAG: RDD family protein [Bacteroidota bacterium]
MTSLLFRSFAFMIDLMIGAILGSPFHALGLIFGINELSDMGVFIGWVYILIKDTITPSGSFSKKLLGLKLISQKNDKISYFQSIVRNLFLFAWPLELFISLINKGKRIGDLIANTEVVIKVET